VDEVRTARTVSGSGILTDIVRDARARRMSVQCRTERRWSFQS